MPRDVMKQVDGGGEGLKSNDKHQYINALGIASLKIPPNVPPTKQDLGQLALDRARIVTDGKTRL